MLWAVVCVASQNVWVIVSKIYIIGQFYSPVVELEAKNTFSTDIFTLRVNACV